MVVRKIIITNQHGTIFTVRNNVFGKMEGDVDSPSIKQKALALISNNDDPDTYRGKLGRGILYVKYRNLRFA